MNCLGFAVTRRRIPSPDISSEITGRGLRKISLRKPNLDLARKYHKFTHFPPNNVISIPISLCHFPSISVTSHSFVSLSIRSCHFPSFSLSLPISMCHFLAFVSISGYALSHHSASFPISLCNFSLISAYTLFQKKAVLVSTSLQSFPST